MNRGGNRATPAADGAISHFKRWLIGTDNKPPRDLTRDLGEFCFRSEFRNDPQAAFETLLGLAVRPRAATLTLGRDGRGSVSESTRDAARRDAAMHHVTSNGTPPARTGLRLPHSTTEPVSLLPMTKISEREPLHLVPARTYPRWDMSDLPEDAVTSLTCDRGEVIRVSYGYGSRGWTVAASRVEIDPIARVTRIAVVGGRGRHVSWAAWHHALRRYTGMTAEAVPAGS